jgi:hypothetical protein
MTGKTKKGKSGKKISIRRVSREKEIFARVDGCAK